jgi:hypothetical protein
VTAVHIAVGVAALVLMAGCGLLGAWCWWRVQSTPWFWRLLRAGQGVVVLEALLGGILQLGQHKASGIHIIYGLLPLAVSFIAEQFRVSAAETILAERGLSSAQDVGRLPESEQHGIVAAIVSRELGVMTLAALAILGLAIRAATT